MEKKTKKLTKAQLQKKNNELFKFIRGHQITSENFNITYYDLITSEALRIYTGEIRKQDISYKRETVNVNQSADYTDRDALSTFPTFFETYEKSRGKQADSIYPLYIGELEGYDGKLTDCVITDVFQLEFNGLYTTTLYHLISKPKYSFNYIDFPIIYRVIYDLLALKEIDFDVRQVLRKWINYTYGVLSKQETTPNRVSCSERITTSIQSISYLVFNSITKKRTSVLYVDTDMLYVTEENKANAIRGIETGIETVRRVHDIPEFDLPYNIENTGNIIIYGAKRYITFNYDSGKSKGIPKYTMERDVLERPFKRVWEGGKPKHLKEIGRVYEKEQGC